MISKEISNTVLTVSCDFHPPKGGVSQVVFNYEQYVFPHFKYIVNSGMGNKFFNLAILVGGLFRMLIRLAFDRHIRIVHIHTASNIDFKRSTYFVQLAKIFRKKVVLHIHGGGFKKYFATNHEWIAKELNRCDTLVVLSDSWKKWFETILPRKRIEVLENVVPQPIKVKKKKSDNRLHLLFLGSITESKGIFDLLDVISNNKNVFEGKLCLHIGGNGKVDKLTNLIEAKDLQDMVTYEGWADEKKKSFLFSLSDIFILPSYTEGLPVSILEAMSYGLPIIATRIGGIPDIVSENENGMLFEAGDKEAIEHILFQCLEDTEGLCKLGEKSSKYVGNYFPDAVSFKLNSVYQNLL